MKLFELLSTSGIKHSEACEDPEINGVTCDSRRVRPGYLFVCLPGLHRDSTEFIGRAYENGAVAVLTEKPLGGAEIVVDDTLLAMARLCRTFYGGNYDKLRLVAVTGTNGKTTILSLLRSIAQAAGKMCGSIGTLGIYSGAQKIFVDGPDPNANMTTPDPEELYTALSRLADDGCEFVFIEASSHALARKKLDALSFEVGIFTNLSRDHLDFHGDFYEYAAAKSRLYGLCRHFIANADDPNVGLIAPMGIGCSVRGRSDVYAESIRYSGENGCAYRLVADELCFTVSSPMPGEFTVMNTLEAAAAALTLGFSPCDIAAGIAMMRSVPGRMERVALSRNAPISVYIDYAHTPDALEKVLLSAKKLAGRGRVVVLFGCGGDRDHGKRPEMGAIATRYADYTIITSDNSRSEEPEAIISDILAGVDANGRYTVIVDRADAIAHAIKESRAGDVIILAGKGHEKYEIDKNGRHDFDEAACVRKAWLER